MAFRLIPITTYDLIEGKTFSVGKNNENEQFFEILVSMKMKIIFISFTKVGSHYMAFILPA